MPLIGGIFIEVRDCVFIKGFPSDSGIDVSDVREYFQEKVGKCCVQMTALSKDKRWSFITLKFDSTALAEDAIDRFNGKYLWGHKVQISFWRVPKSLTQSGRFERNYHNLNSRRWDDKRSIEEETEKSSRHNNDLLRVTSTKHMSRDSVVYDDKEELRVDQDNFRRYQESAFPERRKNFRNFSYKEHCNEYSQQHWSSDGGEDGAYPIFDDNWTGWDSDFSSRNENLSEREYYDREEELSHAHEEDIWAEREVDHEREQDFGQYDSYPEIYKGNLTEEGDDSPYAYNEGLFEDTWEEPPYRGEDLMPRNREWHDDREFPNTQDCRNQEGNRNSFPSYDKERQWPRWEAVAPSSPSRRKPSDPDVITDTPKDSPWVQNPRSCNKLREFTGRRAAALSEERPRSDEWLRNTHRYFRERGRHSAAPVNLRPEAYGHRGPPLLEKTLKGSSKIDSNSAYSRRGRSSISPVRNRHSSANRESSRSLSAERSSDFKLQGTSPGSERSSHAFNEQRLEQRKRESLSYSPNSNNKVPLLRGRSNEDGNGGRRGNDLRRSLMLHQQRKNSSLRERSREKGIKHSERAAKPSPDKRDISPGYNSSAESSSSTQGTNRKRYRYDDEKRRDDVETPKRRRKTSLNNSDNASTYSVPENGNSDFTGKKRIKTSGSRKQPSLDKKRKTGQQREHVTDNSIKKRADRLLNDVAVTLTECKISLRRPGSKEDSSKEGTSSSITSVALKGVDSVRGHTIKPTGQSEGSRSSEKSRQEHDKPVATENPQSLDTFEVDRCTNETTVEDWAVGDTPDGNISTPDNISHMAISCDGSSDQDMSEVGEDDSSIDLSRENLDYAEKSAWTDEVSPENLDFLDITKNCTFIVDDSEKTDRVEVLETDFQRTSKVDFTENVEEEENSLQENCHKDEPKITNEPAEKPVGNSYDFALFQSPVKENNICIEKDTCNEIMSTNLQHDDMEISPAEENTPKLDLAQETWLRGDFGVCEEGKNQLGTSSSSTTEVGRDSDGNVCQKDVQTSVQQTSHSCQELGDTFSSEETSPGVLLSNKVFCHPVELNNTENAMIERDEEDHIMEKVSPDVTKTEHETSELSKDGLSVNPTRPEGLPSEIDVCSIDPKALKQEGYNLEDANCDNSGILGACAMEKVQVDAIYTEKEQCVSESEYHVHSHEVNNFDKETCKVECCEVNPQYIEGDNEGITDVISTVLEVREMEDNVNYFKCQEKATYTNEEVYIVDGAKVTQREVYDNGAIDHVCNSISEECQGDDADFDATNIEQVRIDVVNNTQQNVSNKVSVGEDVSNRGVTNMEDAVVDAGDLEQEHCDLESMDVMCREKSSQNVLNRKDEENNSENVGFVAFNTQEFCDMESNDVTSGVNSAKQERHSSNNFDFTNEDRKHDHREHKVYNMVDGCVTQQEVYWSNNGSRSDNMGKENHTEVNGGVFETDTDQESYHLDTNSYNMADAKVPQEQRSITNNATEDPGLNFSSQEVKLSETASKDSPAHIRTHHSCWTSLEPCHSNAAQAQYSPTPDVDATKSSASSFSNRYVNPQEKERHHLVAEDFEHVDMEISSGEEHRDHFTGSSICVNTSTSTINNDRCKPYSPSSPTWRSDEHRSPLPKDDTSPYSPSHPTNVSEGDVEKSITAEDESYKDSQREADALICDTMEAVYPDVPKNKSRSRGAGEEEEVLHFNQIIKGDSMGDITPRSSRFSRSPNSGAALFQRVLLAKGFIDEDLPTKDLTKNLNVTSSNENGGGVKDSKVCSDKSTTDDSSKDNVKPLLRSEKRTKSLPASVSMDAKPKVVYVTAAKTYDFYTNSGTQHKPRIFYATNDKTAGPARSLSLDTALGKCWPLGKNSVNRPVDCDQQPTVALHVEPLSSDGSFISDAPLKRMKFAAQDDDQEAVRINITPKSARCDEGPDNCIDYGVTGSTSSLGKESLVPSSNADQDTYPSGYVPESERSLVIQAPLEMRKNSLSTDQTPSQMTESKSNWERSNVSNMNCGSGETPGTSNVTNKIPISSGSDSRDFGFSDQGTTFPNSSVQPGITVLEVEGENEKDVQSECLREVQQQVLPLGNMQTLSNSTSCSANKRTHPDSTREASRPCKVPRKPLKLIIPTTPLINHGMKRTSEAAHRGRYCKKTSTCTVTRSSVNLVPESNSLNVLQGDVSAISEFSGDKDTMITEKDPYSENVELACSLPPAISSAPAITDCPSLTCKTGNTSPFTAHRPPCNTSSEKNNIMEKEANSCSGKESEWIALKMEQLRKKKEEIEQVYKRECHTVVNVVKMLVSNDPRLEGLLQNAVRRSLQDMGRRCVQELEKQVRPGP